MVADPDGLTYVPFCGMPFTFREACENARKFSDEFSCDTQIVRCAWDDNKWELRAPIAAVRLSHLWLHDLELEKKLERDALNYAERQEEEDQEYQRQLDEEYEENEVEVERERQREAWLDRYGTPGTSP